MDDSGTLTITGTGDMTNFSYIGYVDHANCDIPWYSSKDSIKSVVIESGVTSIGNHAFRNCKNLKSIDIPASVTSIGNNAFNSCSRLTSITIPASVTSIGNYTFNSCKSLTSITIPASVTLIGSYAFGGCTGLTSITIPGSVTSIGDSAFGDCTGLTSITIPASVTLIGSFAFNSCVSLTSITIPASVTSIGDSAFNNCKTLKEVIFPKTLYMSNAKIPSTATQIKYTVDGDTATVAEITAPEGTTTVTIPETIGKKSVTAVTASLTELTGLETVIFSSGTSITVPDNAVQIKYKADGNDVTATVVQPATGDTTVTVPDTIGGKPVTTVIFVDGTSVTIPDNAVQINYKVESENAIITKIIAPADKPVTAPAEIDGKTVATSKHYHIFHKTWKSDENGHWYGCDESDCAEKLNEAAHTWDEGVIDQESTGSTTTVRTYTCTVCGKQKNETFLTWTLVDGTLTISGSGDMPKYSENSAPWYSNKSEITKVVIENGMTSISDYAFYQCDALTGITIPNSVTSIGGYAFYKCSGLKSINIPDSVTSIGEYAFSGCYDLASITIPDSVTSIGDDVFSNCSGLTSISIPNSVTSIGGYAFFNCLGLTSIDIPDSVTSIGSGAFNGCSGLTSINIPTGVTSIGDSTFNGCSGLTSITIPTGVTSIGVGAFDGCSGLTSITIPTGVTLIGNSAFGDCSKLTTVILPDSLDTSNAGILDTAAQIKYAVADNTVTITQIIATAGTTVTIPETIDDKTVTAVAKDYQQYVDKNTHNHIGGTATCTKKAECDICGEEHGELVKHTLNKTDRVEATCIAEGNIEYWTCSVCDKKFSDEGCITEITDITIPVTAHVLQRNEENTGYTCSYCKEVFPDTTGTCGENLTWALDYIGTLTISGKGAMADNDPFAVDDAPWYSYRKKITKVVIEDGVTSICYGAFNNCSGLTSIDIPSSVTSIDGYAFGDCPNLTSIDIPDGVTSIGNSTFTRCSKLTSITIPDSVTSIDTYVFSGCSSLKSITISDNVTSIGSSVFAGCSSLTSITIPNNVTSIGVEAFKGCSRLTSITIPSGVTSIGDNAFSECYKLTEVILPADLDASNAKLLERATKVIKYKADNDNVTITEITLPEGTSTVTIPETIGGKTVIAVAKDYQQYVDKTTHTKHIGGTATCIAKAVCGICGDEYGDFAEHTLNKTDRVEPTCTTAGNIDYWTCSVCSKIFSDGNAATEISDTATILGAKGHSFAQEWSSDGTNHWHACSGCDEKSDEAGHTWNAGVCTVCSYEHLENEHTVIAIGEAKAPTCTATGMTAGEKCSVCGKVLTAQAVLPMIEHTDGNNDTECDSCGEKLAYIIDGYMYDVDGKAVSGDMKGLNNYAEGEAVLLEAPAVDGYNFIGWYAYDKSEGSTTHYTGDNLCTSRKYSFNAAEDKDLVAVYKALGTASVTIEGGSDFTINGEKKTTSITQEYPLGSTVTAACNDADFEYWKNSAGMVVSREQSYSFTVTGKETITAVFNITNENQTTVVFESFYGQVVGRNQLASGGTMTIPGLPFRYGYTAAGWDFNGDGKYDETSDTLAAAIERGLASDDKLVKIVPVYELNEVSYAITVTNGSGSGTYKQNDVVTAVANTAASGQKFSHWVDDANNIVSYSETYQFFAAKNMTVTAVYVAEEVKVEAKGTTEIIDSFADKAKGKLTFVSMSTVPEGCTIEFAGIIATNDGTCGGNSDSFNASTAQYVRGNACSGNAYRFTWNKSNVAEGATWYVRAYLVYRDAEGNVNTVYGEIVSLTMN